MKLEMYSIRDAKGVYSVPYFKRSHGDAEREFFKLTNDKQTNISQFPEDFDLYYVGSYEDETGTFNPLDTPRHMLKAVNCVSKGPA